jgi:GWxTD domain-containing protein
LVALDTRIIEILRIIEKLPIIAACSRINNYLLRSLAQITLFKTFVNFIVVMRYSLVLLFLVSVGARAQALRDVNYNFLYDPTEPFTLSINAVRAVPGWTAFYDFALRDSAQRVDQYHLSWDIRPTIDEKQGTALDPSFIKKTNGSRSLAGEITIPASTTPQVLTLKVLNNAVKRAWMFYRILEPNYPVNGYVIANGKAVGLNYVKVNTPLMLASEGGTKVISYYNDDFPAAVPAFSEGMAKVSRGMKVDSTFNVPVNQEISFSEPGLYLVQRDTMATEGFAFRVQDDYPRLAKVESLADPLIYICTKQEFEKVKAAKGDKKAFDRVILGITGNTERARNFMRNYFKRVEWANLYFTSYKEGWKTDRGMIYILFGLPEEVYKFSDREVWNYKSSSLKASFNFVKSSTIFDPDNYVLIREKKFQETWYEKVDLWRNARF